MDSALEEAWKAFQRALGAFQAPKQVQPQQPTFAPGTPTYDDQGRILGFTGAPPIAHPIDRTDQALAKRMAVLNKFKEPLYVQPQKTQGALQRTLFFGQPVEGGDEIPQEERTIQDLLIQHYANELRRQYGL